MALLFSSPDFSRIDHGGQVGEVHFAHFGICQDRPQFIKHMGSRHEESFRSVYEVMNDLADNAIRRLFLELVIDAKKKDDVVTREVILTERFLQCGGSRNKINDLESGRNTEFGKDRPRRIHTLLQDVTTMNDRGTPPSELERYKPVVNSDIEHAGTLRAMEQITQPGKTILISTLHASTEPTFKAGE